jgi:hypothetical protein
VDTLSVLIGVLAGVIQVYGYWIYNRNVEKGIVEAEGTSWGLWGLGTFVALVIFNDLSGDWVKDTLLSACSASSFIFFILLLKRRMVRMPDRINILIVCLDASVLAYWYFGGLLNEDRESVVPSILVAADTIITFVPMIRGILQKKVREVKGPWTIWTIAYGTWIAAILFRLETPEELTYPVTCFFLHLLVWAILSKQTAKS